MDPMHQSLAISYIVVFHLKFSQLLSYRLMFHQGIGDILLMTAQFAAGISATFDSPMPFWLNKIFGAVFNGGYQSSLPFVLLLTVNRLIVICDFPALRPLLENRYAPLWIGLPYLWGFCLGISYLCPNIDVLFDLGTFSWQFSGDYGSWAQSVDFYAGESIIVASTVIYVFILAYIFLKKFIHLQRAGHAHVAIPRRNDYGLLLNIFLTYASLALLLLAFNVQPRISETKSASGVVNLLIAIRAGLDPFICILTIKSVRRVFIAKRRVDVSFVTTLRT
ncbi:hypothetical protein QR680_008925 [Steinernema hermaphroditum]|uniref:7TM GPCR serpentine receptor class x (Srx) domain-containing protein n=1 Tax=Steinernema hermaphroditum TaxID=289476 RepID=A0AA39IJW9_9BILA|nr:hypothetical protein QR680_008925 [Steinernema hermaphroditum]